MSDQSPIDHSGCVATSFGNINGHTHEGEVGYWAFPSEAPPPPPEALTAAVDTTVRALRLELQEALSDLERGVESLDRLRRLSDKYQASIDPGVTAELKALVLKVADYASTIGDQIEGKA